jgi:hypothetical protein
MFNPSVHAAEVLVVIEHQVSFVEFIESEIAFPVAKLSLRLIAADSVHVANAPREVLAAPRNDIEFILCEAAPALLNTCLPRLPIARNAGPNPWQPSVQIFQKTL